MTWYLVVQSHYLNLIDLSSKVFYGIHLVAISQEGVKATILYNEFENYIFEIIAASSRGQ